MSFERLLENNALAFAQSFAIDDHLGFETCTAVSKLAWSVSPNGDVRVANPQREIRLMDVHHTGPDSSVRFPSDYAATKPGTDVLVLGAAHPPKDQEVTSMDVGVRVLTDHGTLKKSLKVFGRRVYMRRLKKVVPGPAQPMTAPVPLVYEYAFGGADHDDPEVVDWINPVGRGVCKNPDSLIGEEAPRIESTSGSRPDGLGPIARHWKPRVDLYGTLDEDYLKNRHPVAPLDFDERYHACGHPDLWSPNPLGGDETFEITGMTPEGVWRFRLPRYEPRFDVDIDGESKRLDTHLDTVLIDLENPDERVVELTWRAAVRMPKKSERVGKILITDATTVMRHWYDPNAPRPRS